MKYKAIFDTNTIRSEHSENFLGGKKELPKFVKLCEIIIPDMVIEEIKQQKHRELTKKKTNFISNFYYKKIKSDPSINLPPIEIEQEILEMERNNNINYQTICLTQQDGIIEKMRELALQRLPPFESKTDKGFKDAYIYFTILEYVKSQTDKSIFVVTKDGRLKEALIQEKHNRIKVVKDYDEFNHCIIEQYRDDYFVDTIRSYFKNQSIASKDLIIFWKNMHDDDILQVESGEQEFALKISSREIVGHVLFTDVQNAKNKLINTATFEATHEAIESLQNYCEYLSDGDIEEILNACYHNFQIWYIAHDDDVKEFILKLYENKKYLADDTVKVFIEGL